MISFQVPGTRYQVSYNYDEVPRRIVVDLKSWGVHKWKRGNIIRRSYFYDDRMRFGDVWLILKLDEKM